MKQWVKRGTVYLAGLFIMALRVSVSKASDLGVSPVNSIPAVVSRILNIDMGICTVVVFTIFILIQLLILRREFKIMYFLQIIGSAIFGLFVSVTNKLSEQILPSCETYVERVLYIIISMILVAAGILLYLQADILSLPGEGVMQAVSAKTGIDISISKMIFDWTVVVIAGILSLVFLGKLSGVREGTVISAFGVGICLKAIRKLFQKPLQVFLDGEKKNVTQNALDAE